jgi:hypothetical protein
VIYANRQNKTVQKKNTTKNKKIDDAVVCLSFAKYVEIAI